MKAFITKYYSVIFILFLVIVIGLSFYLGYEQGSTTRVVASKGIIFSCPNTVLDKERIVSSPVKAKQVAVDDNGAETISLNQTGGAYMGSKNGTKYYTPNCPASKRIKPENVIWFQSTEDATLQGYSKGSC